MSGYAFVRAAVELALPAELRPLDRALARWVRAHGGSALLAEVAAWASFADGAGDSALPLVGAAAGRHGMRRLDDEELAALTREPLVAADPGAPAAAFVFDADGRFYLRRNAADEAAVAAAVRARRDASAPAAAARADLDALFGGRDDAAVAPQRAAVAAAPGRRLFVLTGGPGTGKTTTVLRMLLMLQRCAGRPLAIQAAAPTGKAAQRLVESLRTGREALAPALGAEWAAYLDAIPDREALTLHRLLAFDPRRDRFRRNARDPLPGEVVVVDEASMMDLALLRALLAAVRPEATLVLVGDPDQLTSVAAGSALQDLVSVLTADGGCDLVRLEHSFRAERALVPVHAAVRAGDVAGFDAAWRAAGIEAVRHAPADAASLREVVLRWADRLLDGLPRPTLPALPADAPPGALAARDALVREALAALRGRQLLCALREGPSGALALDAAVEARLRQRLGVASGWFAGRPVIVTRNDYAARLFNGDVGLCLADAEGGLRVWFETVGADGLPAVRGLPVGALPVHEGAFAITIHKSQGSEYGHVAVVLPPAADSPVLSRQLLYTGLSRARRSLELWATDGALRAALEAPVRRAGGLAVRLGIA
ncbi:exodeoxyribonuclease V subunit alpha [Coralloluteibacterium stylophorae]|uniref:RecBCD enzyme subunit RecD n=1 Tax=Coralloluteibacterium stylophorae TaxID=1776034 RepID=A0A8J7VT31_9GAMM|nr:exodeoxyribonuclease V subunit alpha [Coralloluteibacterium stylophorae]MBS7458457.1 exodeoxyribonuclease V subunit alpha [Coralloluteibacterium stylophorae]